MDLQIKLILTACIVNSGFTFAPHHNRRDQFQNLFDSITKNDAKENGFYREELKQEVGRQRQAFDGMKEELRIARHRNIQNKNSYKIVAKRETNRSKTDNKWTKLTYPEQTTPSTTPMVFTIPSDVQEKIDAINSPKVAKVARRILEKKGVAVEKLIANVEEKFCVDAATKLKERKDLDEKIRREYKAEFKRRFAEKLHVFKQVAVAEHYDEVKHFYDFVCAIHLIENTLRDVLWKTVGRTRYVLQEMNKTVAETIEETSPLKLISSPHLPFYSDSSDYVVPGERRYDVDLDYNSWRLYLTYQTSEELATAIRKDLESMRGDRTMQDVIAEFSFVLAKLLPLSHYVRSSVIPQARAIAATKEGAIFLDDLPLLMPGHRWYFPKKYLDYFNVLRRALKTTPLEVREYSRDDKKSVLPSSDECLTDPALDHIYEYVDLYFSTAAPPLPDFGMRWFDS